MDTARLAFEDEQTVAQAVYYFPDDRELTVELNRLPANIKFQHPSLTRLLSAWRDMTIQEAPLSRAAIEVEYQIKYRGDQAALEAFVEAERNSDPVIYSPVLSRAIDRIIARSKLPRFQEALESFGNGEITQQELAAEIGIDSESRMDDTMTLTEAYNRIKSEGERERVHTGFRRLDACTHGLPRGRVTVLAAKPGVGKTDFALAIAVNVLRSWKRVFFASAEMDHHELAKRVRSSIGIEADSLGDNMVIDTAAHQTVPRIAAQAMFHKPDLVVVDYLQILASTEQSRDLYTRASVISNQLRSAAKGASATGTPPAWLVLSQLSRNTRTEQDLPTLSDLRDSGAIEQDADSVLFLHEPDKRDPDYPRTVQVTVAKNRSGATGYMLFRFTPGQSRWEEK